MRLLVIGAALALLAGCGGGESESGLTAEEEEAKLNEAAAMLDEAPDDLGAAEKSIGENSR